MKKELLATENGFSLVELLLAVALFSIIVTAFGGALLYGQEDQRLAGERTRAVFLAEESLEAVRNIRDADFSALSTGTHGLAVSGGQWELTGSSDATDVFTRTITISDVDAGRKEVASTVSWDQNLQRSGEVVLTTYITNWRGAPGGPGGGGPPASSPTPTPAADTCTLVCQNLSYSGGTCRANATQCNNNGETYETSGDEFCPGSQNADTCCCAP